MVQMRDTVRAYELLELAQRNDPRMMLRSASPGPAGSTIYFVLERDGRRALYVEVAPGAERGYEDRTAGYSLEVRDFSEFKSGVALMLRLVDERFVEPFTALVASFMESAHDPSDAPAKLRATATKFRIAFHGRRDRVLSEEEQLGLIAELHLLTALQAAGLPGLSAAWQYAGPMSRHDFTFSRVAIEVKATAAREEFSLSIHGFEQLTPPEGSDLWLYAEQFEETPDGQTLPEVVEEARMSGLLGASLEAKLEATGYLPKDAEHYSRRFRRLRAKSRIVDSGMPRLTSAFLPSPDLAEQIKAVNYRIDFGPIPGFEDDEAVQAIVAGLKTS